MTEIYIQDFSVASRLGMDVTSTRETLTAGHLIRPDTPFDLLDGSTTLAAALPEALAPDLAGRTRTNRILSHLLKPIEAGLDALKGQYGAHRIGTIIGTSTTGIEEGVAPLEDRLKSGTWSQDYVFSDQELGDTAAFLAQQAGVDGPAYTVSTACTSGAKSMTSAARLIQAGIIDAAICGGVDSIARLTLNGFNALDSISPVACLPFSANRRGINIGEGGALFLLSRTPSAYRLAGWGESSDAYHMSSPHPEGVGAETAMRQAMQMGGISAGQVDFIHLHGTATPLNDAMEATMIHRLFGDGPPCASTKGSTGHTLGAAGAIQAALNLIAMDAEVYPGHVFDGEYDPDLPAIRLSVPGERPHKPLEYILSASYAFGGSNIALTLARG
ncbi:MAG: beta-ketoacyl-[acyl-carrier-protein] synthase II [Hirschia sp.]|nr:beta-ketoacyl-[acyl-carrier-protein] synthase II [Hirschia sp.]MBF19286.1 beta-ketoacyl-[acyl-carrier-protein] synthase II [Hirschia sp.]|tara:strand:+ start:1959 stop:3119 length:1161 start_codon:yes stop_codon:yes gene_type:complete